VSFIIYRLVQNGSITSKSGEFEKSYDEKFTEIYLFIYLRIRHKDVTKKIRPPADQRPFQNNSDYHQFTEHT
jgi:hypothetical protein